MFFQFSIILFYFIFFFLFQTHQSFSGSQVRIIVASSFVFLTSFDYYNRNFCSVFSVFNESVQSKTKEGNFVISSSEQSLA